MAHIRPREVLAAIAIAALFQRRVVVFIFRVLERHAPVPCQRHAVSARAGLQHAVEHIHAAQHAFQQAIRATHAHEIARLVLRHIGHHGLQHLVHHAFRLADAEAADAEAGEIHAGDRLRALDAKVAKHAALHDAKQRLILARVRVLAALRPAVRALHRVDRVFPVGRIRRALVKAHRDIRAEALLHVHDRFRRKEVLAAVDMGAEHHAVFLNIVDLRKRKHLKSAAVGQNRAIPVHEFVQAACLLHELVPGPKIEVVRVAEDDVRAHVHEVARGHRLDGRLRADGHEDRRFDVSVRGVQHAIARAALLADVF